MNVLNRILGGKPKNSGSNDSPKETLWQKASSLRQSLRGRPRSRRPASLYLGDGGSPPGKSRLRREWGSHRDLSREKRHAAKSWHSNTADDDGGFQSRLQAPGEDSPAPKAWPSTSTLQDDQPRTSTGRSLRKLTKDSGYETSVQGEPDYVNRDCWTEGERDSTSAAAVPELQPSHQRESRQLQRSFSCYTQAESSSAVTGHKTASTGASGDTADISRAKSTTTLHERAGQQESGLPYIARSSQQQQDQDMGARRFRKASVYQVLASRSGLDFAPVVHQTRPWVDPTSPRDTTTTTPTSRPEALWSTPQNSEKRAGSPTPPSSPPTPPTRSTSSHEKYPSWPVTSLSEDSQTSSTSTSTQRSHSWTQETDYPKEKPAGYVRPKKSFKINPHQLQPVLERSNEKRSSPVLEYTPTRVEDVFPKDVSSSLTSCRAARDPQVHSPPERECSAESYLSKYDDVLRHYQRWNDAPLLQRLYQEGERQGWSYTSSGTTAPAGSQDPLKWHGSYSDLSALSVQISNRSSLFDSGHSTLPDSGRLSPQSSCDGSVMTLSQNEAGHRVVSRLASQAVVAHSARVMPPKRHESESVLYYSTGEGSGPTAPGETGAPGNRVSRLRAAFDPLSGSRVSMSSSATSDETAGERLLFLDPYKKHRVSDPELKAIQKQAVLSFYKRQTSHNGKDSTLLASAAARNRTLPRHGLPNKFSVPVSEPPCPSKSAGSPRVSSTSLGSPPGKIASWTSARSWSVPDLAQPLSLACVAPTDSSSRSDASKSPATPPREFSSSSVAGDTWIKASGPSSLPVVLRTEEERALSGWQEEPVRNNDANSSQTSCASSKEGQRGRRAQLREVPGGSPTVKLVTSDGVTTVASPVAKEEDVTEPPAVPPRRGGSADPPPPPRPPPKGSTPPANDLEDPELKRIAETTALNNGRLPPVTTRSPEGGGGSTCSSPDLPLPPPPPPAQPSDDPLPPPPEDLTTAHRSTTVYPKDSYMSYRTERQRSRVEGSYRRSYQSSTPVTDDPVNNNNVESSPPPPPPLTSSPNQQPTWPEGCVTPEDDLHNNNHVGGGLSNSWSQTCVSENHKGSTKSPEELECERLSIDLLACFGDAALRSLLVPSPDHKTVSDYMKGLVDRSTWQRNRCPVSPSISPSSPRDENQQETIPPISAYFNTSEEKAKLLTRFSQEIGDQEWASDCEITKKKEELACSISRKLDALRAEQVELREEMSQNEALGQVVTRRVEALARPNELDKYKLHVEEMEKIVHLLLSLSGRLARVHNALGTQGNSASEDERRALEAKREKLSSQHEEARRLKESIDRRSQQVSQLLRRYLTPEEYADYDHFVRVKSKLLVDARELDEKIRLGEEQLAALKANGLGMRSPS
ncbi:protein Shroom3-like isoform X2 [Ornithodoros turicata]|uniref:protein Shroom3-like isoform X2 n=1 Tax=Ornithodoros turicata TaxID=34597 RepID=UPI0031394882